MFLIFREMKTEGGGERLERQREMIEIEREKDRGVDWLPPECGRTRD